MKSLLQRVKQASVCVDGNTIGAIGAGILVFVAFEKGDTDVEMQKHLHKLLSLRIFPDEAGKMNLSVTDIEGELLIVSQFTLAGSCQKGTRPSFDNAMPPKEAEAFYESYLETLRKQTPLKVETGQFAAMMDVSLINDGPVTLWLD